MNSTRSTASHGTSRVRTRCPVSHARRGEPTAAKRIRACSVMRDLVALTVTGPGTAASSASNASRTAGSLRAKCESSGTTAQECGRLTETNVWPQRGQRHTYVNPRATTGQGGSARVPAMKIAMFALAAALLGAAAPAARAETVSFAGDGTLVVTAASGETNHLG